MMSMDSLLGCIATEAMEAEGWPRRHRYVIGTPPETFQIKPDWIDILAPYIDRDGGSRTVMPSGKAEVEIWLDRELDPETIRELRVAGYTIKPPACPYERECGNEGCEYKPLEFKLRLERQEDGSLEWVE